MFCTTCVMISLVYTFLCKLYRNCVNFYTYCVDSRCFVTNLPFFRFTRFCVKFWPKNSGRVKILTNIMPAIYKCRIQRLPQSPLIFSFDNCIFLVLLFLSALPNPCELYYGQWFFSSYMAMKTPKSSWLGNLTTVDGAKRWPRIFSNTTQLTSADRI